MGRGQRRKERILLGPEPSDHLISRLGFPTRILVWGVLFTAFLLLCAPFRAETQDALYIDKDGNVGVGTLEPKAKLDVNGTVRASAFEGDGAIPKGVIVMWYGKVDQVPRGWALCDGTNGTPDLRARFIVGAGEGGNLSYVPGDKGEPDKHLVQDIPSLSVDTSPAPKHSHKFPPQYYARGFLRAVVAAGKKWSTGIDTGGPYQKQQPTEEAGEHIHKVDIQLDKDKINIGTSSGENRPRWYALCFIMKL